LCSVKACSSSIIQGVRQKIIGDGNGVDTEQKLNIKRCFFLIFKDNDEDSSLVYITQS